MGWEEGNNNFFLLSCGKISLEEGEGNNAIYFSYCSTVFVMACIQ